MVGDLEYPHRLACLPRQGKSHPYTGRSLQSCIFIVQESGEGIIRLPEHPLIQDSLTSFSLIKAICLPLPYEQSTSPGPLRSGGSTWLDLLKGEAIIRNTYW